MIKLDSGTSAGLLSVALSPERLYDSASSFNLFKKLEEADPLERAMLDKDHVFQAIEVADLFIHKESSQSDSCLLYTSPSPRDRQKSRMPSSA